MFRNLLHRSRNTANVAIIPNNVNCMYRNRITINLNGSKTSALVSCQAIAESFFGDQVFGYNYNSRRHFNSGINIFGQFDKIKTSIKLRDLKKVLEVTKNPSEMQILEYLRVLRLHSPRDAVQYIEKGWETKTLPANEVFVKEYLQAVSNIGKIDSINIKSLNSLINDNLGLLSSSRGSDGSQVPYMFSPSVGSSSMLSAGASKGEPLYVSSLPPEISWKKELWKLIRALFQSFLFVALIMAVMENFNSSSSGGGISKMVGIQSVVKQAENPDKRFDDVVGVDEAKNDLQEIVLYLKDPKKFTRLGGQLPKGVLLTGPPGTGKTLLAKAVAGEAGVPFFYASGSEFEEMYVGVGSRRVRELFSAAKEKTPCIIFIDEIDAIGGSRHKKEQSGMNMTLNELLVQMDGFEQNNGVIVIAATNIPDRLDSALVRPGRFDKQVNVPMPDVGGRSAILELYSKKLPLGKDVDIEQLAKGTPGFSGAELFNLVNQAAIKASVDGLNNLTMETLEWAKDKILMGAERKSAIISKETMRCTAFHEAGHALVALKTDGADPIHKATILPRGRALGMVMQLPDGDQTSMSRKQMLARLDVCMGGRVAEELIFGQENVTSGASNDIMQATRLAKAMVTKYGLSEKIGVVFYDEEGAIGGSSRNKIDDEVKDVLTSSYNRAKTLIEKNRKELEIIANGLLEFEHLSGDEIVDLCKGKKLNMVDRSHKASREGSLKIGKQLNMKEPKADTSRVSNVNGSNSNDNSQNKSKVEGKYVKEFLG